jgi:hypothetical protein
MMSGFSKFIMSLDGLLLAGLGQAAEVVHPIPPLRVPGLDIVLKLNEGGGGRQGLATIIEEKTIFFRQKLRRLNVI